MPTELARTQLPEAVRLFRLTKNRRHLPAMAAKPPRWPKAMGGFEVPRSQRQEQALIFERREQHTDPASGFEVAGAQRFPRCAFVTLSLGPSGSHIRAPRESMKDTAAACSGGSTMVYRVSGGFGQGRTPSAGQKPSARMPGLQRADRPMFHPTPDLADLI